MRPTSDFNFRFLVLLVCMFVLFTTLESCAQSSDQATSTKNKTIKIALLLDTSNSMDGLIEQAKSQLWSIVNELSMARCDGAKPNIQIALYEYGNSRLTQSSGYIKMVTPLTADLDKLSADLFALTTNGGDEFCGQVILTATDQLQWNVDGNDLQVIFIAGNEPFNQGFINYVQACQFAKSKKIVVNTIYCGDFSEGINSQWKTGADLTGGAYMSIAQNTKTVFIESPYDDKISALNDSLNNTYIGFGRSGIEKKKMQQEQDQNAESYSKANKVNRAVTKSSYVYKNESWDLVDAEKGGTVKVEALSENQLPAEMKSMNVQQRKAYVKLNAEKRDKITAQINELNTKRNQYLAEQQKLSANKDNSTLDNAMMQAVRKQAIAQHFVFE